MSQTLIRSAFWIIVITLIGRVMGLVRSIFVSHEFGTTLEASAFSLAFTIPSTIFLFVPGALNAVFIPSLKGLVTEGRVVEAQKLFRKTLTITVVFYLLLSVAIWVWSEPIISFISPGSSIELKALAADLLRWMLPSILFIVLIGIFSSALNVHHSFVIPNISNIVNSGIVIFAILVLVPYMDIHGLALGTTLGFAGAALMMLPKVFREKYSVLPNWEWNDPEVKKMGERFLPIMIGSLITSMNDFIEKYLISGYGDDKIAAMWYAKQVYQVPMSVFIGAFAMPLFPYMVEYLKKKDYISTKETIEKGLTYLLILLIPTTIGMWILSEGIVSVLFERGDFDAYSTEITAYALIFFVLGLYPLAVRDLLTRAFYALENTLIPVIAAVVQILIYILASLIAMPVIGFAGAALGWTIGAIVNALILWVILQRKIGNFVSRKFLISTVKVMLASIAMGICVYVIDFLTEAWNRYLVVSAAIIVGGVIYGLILILLKESLTLDLFSKLLRRLPLKKSA
jgi:putative peptidoglycan lipid II flippase